MSYRPSRRQRVANRLLTGMVRRGKGPQFMRLLTVAGRRTGEPRTTPVVPVTHDGRTWLVSPFGEVDWVRNLRATGTAELRRGDDVVTYAATELAATDDEATTVVADYEALPSFKFVKPYDRNGRHPVFELRPVA